MASACAPSDLAPNEVEADVNDQMSGDARWRVSPSSPCVCTVDAGRRHWTLSC
jgi:hypothetical protein